MPAPSNRFVTTSTTRLSAALEEFKRLRDEARDDHTRRHAAEQVRLVRIELDRRTPNRPPLHNSLRPDDRTHDELVAHRRALIAKLHEIADDPGLEQARINLRGHLAEVEQVLLARVGGKAVAS